MFGRRRRLSAEQREIKQARSRSLRTRTGTEFSSMYIRQYHDGEVGGYITMEVNGQRVGVRVESVNGEKRYHVETGSDWMGNKKASGWVTHEEANRFIYENTKG